jgi:hypothetical protein
LIILAIAVHLAWVAITPLLPEAAIGLGVLSIAGTIQDGPAPFDVRVRELTGEERAVWWQRAVTAFPPYADYQVKTQRLIPILLATRR